jgi:uncharacterized protein DUF3108
MTAAALLAATLAAATPSPTPAPHALPFGPGESISYRISYAHLLAGRARLTVSDVEHEGRSALEFVATARSEGFFAWLFRFRVRDRTIAVWDPAAFCSLRIEKALREGRAEREQEVTFDPAGRARVRDKKIAQTEFATEPCSLDILSALFVTRARGVPAEGRLELPVFDNGKKFRLAVTVVDRETIDLPEPFGHRTPVLVVEPRLVEGTGLFVKEKGARLKIWLTDDGRRVPVRMRSKVAVGSVSADVERYEPSMP